MGIRVSPAPRNAAEQTSRRADELDDQDDRRDGDDVQVVAACPHHRRRRAEQGDDGMGEDMPKRRDDRRQDHVQHERLLDRVRGLAGLVGANGARHQHGGPDGDGGQRGEHDEHDLQRRTDAGDGHGPQLAHHDQVHDAEHRLDRSRRPGAAVPTSRGGGASRCCPRRQL